MVWMGEGRWVVWGVDGWQVVADQGSGGGAFWRGGA